MSKGIESALVPKAYAALSDALEEGLGFALNRVIDAGQCPTENDSAVHRWREAVLEKMKNEVLNAITERFSIVEPEEQ